MLTFKNQVYVTPPCKVTHSSLITVEPQDVVLLS